MITLEDFWNSSNSPVYDDETNELMLYDDMLIHKNAKVTYFHADGYKVFVGFEKRNTLKEIYERKYMPIGNENMRRKRGDKE